MIRIKTPFTKEQALKLKAGDEVLITGIIYTARDAAHKRMLENLKKGIPLPFPIQDSMIYYVGPSPAKEGQVIGSAGPTTSYRMDAYAPGLLDLGLRGMIGKGERNLQVIESMKKNQGVYFGAIGGGAALLASRIKSSKVIAYEDLGAEALRELYVEDFPAIVVIDTQGQNMYEIERKKYQELLKSSL